MSFFDKKNAIDAASKKRAGGKAAAGMAAAAVAAGGAVLASEAGAAALANVGSFALNDDGSVTVTYTDGSTATYAAGTFEIVGNQVHVGSSGALLAGGTAGLALLAFLALSGGEEAAASAATSTTTPTTTTTTSTAPTPAPAITTTTALDDASTDPFVATDGDDLLTVADPTKVPASIDGGAGTDELQFAAANSGAIDVSGSSPAISNIEEVSFVPGTLHTGALTVTLDGDDDVTTVDLDDLNTGANAVAVTGLDADDTLEVEVFGGGTLNLDLDMNDDDTSVTVAASVDTLGGASATLDLDDVSPGSIETLTLDATGGDVVVDTDDMIKMKSLIITGDKGFSTGADVLGGGGDLTETVDASGSTGDITVNIEGLVNSYTGSTGKDTIDDGATALAAAATISTGDGDDTIQFDGTVQSVALTIEAGAGGDTVDLGNVAHTGAIAVDLGAADGEKDMLEISASATGGVSVTSFETTSDEVTINGFAAFADSNGDGTVAEAGDNDMAVQSITTGSTTALDVGLNVISSVVSDASALKGADLVDIGGVAGDDYTISGGAHVYLFVADADSSALYALDDANTAGTIDDADLTLIAEFDFTDITSLSADNFADIA